MRFKNRKSWKWSGIQIIANFSYNNVKVTQEWRTYMFNDIENRKHLQNTEINIDEIFANYEYLQYTNIYTRYIYIILTNILLYKRE